MQNTTIGQILDETVSREANYHIYLVRENETVFYIGQSSSIYDRLESHLGMDWRHAPSVLGKLALENLPMSRAWAVELYSLEDCEQRTLEYMTNELGCTFYTKEVYYHAGGGVDFAERAFISLYHPCLNTTYNLSPTKLPERYVCASTYPQISSGQYLNG